MLCSRIFASIRSKSQALLVNRRWMSVGSSVGMDSGSSTSSSDSDDSSSGSESEDGRPGGRESDTRDAILKSSLEFVSLYGWSAKSLAAGAEKMGLSSTVHGMFSRGGGDLVLYFIRSSNEALSEKLSDDAELALKDPEKKKGTRAIIRDAVELRLRMIVPYMTNWPQAMALMVLPQNTPDAVRQACHMVDDIWYFAGDRSVDFNYYTKRATLGLVYGNTELYMLQDSSEDFQKTWQFLDRRIDNLAEFGKCIRQCQEGSKTFSDVVYSGFHFTRNILNLNEMRR